MEFWGVEVKSGQTLSVQPGENKVLHLSQACLGEVKKDKNESVFLYVEVDGKKLVLGTLTPEKLPQQLFDIVFEKDFVLTHNWKHGSVYFYGYKADNPFEDPEEEFDDSDSEEEDIIPLQAANNGKPEIQVKQEKKAPVVEKANAVKDSAAGKQKVKIVEPSKAEDDDDSDDDSDDVMSEDGGSDSEDDDSLDDEDASDDEGDSDDEEETPKKVQSGKKRPSESATKTPVPEKKAKLVTPQKTDGKKGGGHVATPHPSKQAGKTPANKSNQQTPKSAEGEHSCKSCKKSFKSEVALSSHNQAKHSAGK